MTDTTCWSCRRDMGGLAVCAHCGARLGEKPSLMSKQHPGRLDFRAVLMVIASPVMLVMGLMDLGGDDPTRAWIAIVGGLAFGLFGGLHLWSRYGHGG